MKQIRIFYTVVLLFVLHQTKAQTVNFFKDNIYNLNYNPASEITVPLHFAIPLVSNINVQAGTNIFIYNDVVSMDREGHKVIDPKGFFSKIPNSSYGEVFCNLNAEVFGFGFEVNPKLYFMYSSRLQMENTLFVPKGLFQLAADGNLAHIGEEMTISPLLSMLAYLDNSVGFQYKINDNITVAVRGKLLLGMLGANIKESGFSLMTDSEWNLHLKGSALLNLYAPQAVINAINESEFVFDMGSIGRFAMNNTGRLFGALGDSWGGGFDLGADIKLTDNLGIKASLIDMGWIKWDRNQRESISYRLDINPNHPLYQDGELVFTGITDLASIDWNNLSSFFDPFIDELALDSAFLLTKSSPQTYVSMTNPKFFLEGYYQLKNHKFSAMYRMDFIGERVLPAFTLGYNLNIRKLIDLAFCYSVSKGSYGNIGLGFSFNPGNLFHVYAAVDNLPTLFSLYNNIIHVNVQTGVFFTIPAKKVKKEQKN